MNTLLLVVTLVSSLASCFVSCFYAWLNYKRDKERDKIWDTTTKLLCAKGNYFDADEFVQLYTELKFFAENPKALSGHNTITEAIRASSRQEDTRS